MKKHVCLALSVGSLALALWGCGSGGATSGPASATVPAAPTGYGFFAPAGDKGLDAAVLEGSVNGSYVIVKAVKGFDESAFGALGAEKDGSFDMGGYTYFRLRKNSGAVKFVNDLSRLKGVVYAEHELVSSLPPNENGTPAGIAERTARNSSNVAWLGPSDIASVLDDPETWGRFGHFETTQAIDAYRYYGFGPNTVYVADIDSGINRIHEDFADEQGNRIVEYAKSAFRFDGSGFSFVGTGDPFVVVPRDANWDDQGHGSHTAGTIAAVGNNGRGVAGVAWKNVRLISYKCFANAAGTGSDWAIFGGLRDLAEWKKANGITQTIPVNMSLGGSYASQFGLEMINMALENGIVVIAAMGNDGAVKAHYPAAYSGVIAVGATRANGEKVPFSDMGNHISVAAPGYNIYSTGIASNSDYQDMSGTSMAAPFVTGTVAYMLTFNPTLTPDQIKTILETTADDKGAPGWDREYGYGQVNVLKAIRMVTRGPIPASGAVYSTKKITVSVENLNADYDSGIDGYRNAAVGQPVYLYDLQGTYVTLGLTNGVDGSVEFRLLKPGGYKAVSNYFGVKKESALTLGNGDGPFATLSFDVPILLIQTIRNTFFSNGATGADSILTLYDATGTNVLAGPLDKGGLDTLVVAGLTSGETYVVSITPFLRNGIPSRGEYGFNVGFQGKTVVNVDPGRPENVDDGDGNVDAAHAKLIAIGADYGEYLSGGGEWFKFVMR